MLPLKTADLLLPVVGLLAFAVLLVLLVVGPSPDPRILWVVGGKLALDVLLTAVILRQTARWTGSHQPVWSVLGATLVEPLAYQPLRQLGALLGWIAHLRHRRTWIPQR